MFEVKAAFNDHLWESKFVAVVIVQRELYVIEIKNGTPKWWS